MGQSKTKTSSMASGPGMGALTAQGPDRIEGQYQADMANPNRLQPQASGYLSNVIGGQYLNPSSNPHLQGLSDSIWEQVAPNVSSVFSRAGRGTSASDSGLGGALTRGFTSAMAGPMFQQYGQERGLQQQAAGMSTGIDAAAGLPLEQYLERMRSLATLGQTGTQTQSPSTLQIIAGLGSMGASMFSAPAGGTSAATGLAAAFGSDRRIKTDIEKIGEDPRGFGLYTYRYVWDEPEVRRTGVMAQEVALVIPEAVHTHELGFLVVDYGAL
jgi:hypothetical protein